MINKPKLIMFLIATILFSINVYIYASMDNWAGLIYIFLIYIILILVALYDIGKDEI